MEKAYTSPLTLLKKFGLGENLTNVALFKKKALAELDLLGTPTLKINNKEYTKNDILNFADSLQDQGDMAYHQVVMEDTFLLNFLETTVLKYDGQLLYKEIYNDPNFIKWVSPYALNAQKHFAEEILNNNDLRGWNKLSSLRKMMTSQDHQEYYSFLEHTIRKRKDKIQYYTESNSASMSELMTLCDNRFIQMLVSLPEDRFGELRDELALLIVKISVHIFNKKDQSKGKGLMFVAKDCSYSYDLKRSIEEKILNMNAATNNEQSSGGSDATSVWRVILVIISVVIMIFRIARCASHL